MGRLLVNLGGYFRFKSSVDRRYIELTILVTGAFWKAQFEWFAHEPMARKAGVPDDIIQAIQAGEVPEKSSSMRSVLTVKSKTIFKGASTIPSLSRKSSAE